MKALVKLQISIDCEPYTKEYKDPLKEFYKTLKSIKGLQYTVLPIEENDKISEENIFEHGQTKILTPKEYYEAIGTPYDNAKSIIAVFKKFLDRIILSDHLILVDYYIFSDKNEKSKYSDFIIQIFSDHLKKLQKITFITSKEKHKKETEKAIFDGFHNIKSHLKIETKFSNLFHDRFWLCGNRGLFVGSSLNGLGKKYCLIDYIKSEDILEINKCISSEGLI